MLSSQLDRELALISHDINSRATYMLPGDVKGRVGRSYQTCTHTAYSWWQVMRVTRLQFTLSSGWRDPKVFP